MIASLEDAWRWYENARRMMVCMHRLGTHHWSKLPSTIASDKRFQDLEPTEVTACAQLVLDDLSDLCVVLLFSVFESQVREQVRLDVETAMPASLHPALDKAVDDLKESIDNGSFHGVLACFKSVDADLVEEVNQVRKYRNWVAHGRRSRQPDNVTAEIAFDRLQLHGDNAYHGSAESII